MVGHRFLSDGSQLGENNNAAVLTEAQVHHVCKLLEDGRYTLKEISEITGASVPNINQIKARNNWVYISKNYSFSPPKKLKRDINRYGLSKEEICNEEWRAIIFDGILLHYEVSNMGRVRNSNNDKILTPRRNGQGYYKVSLSIRKGEKFKNLFIHRLVAKAFIPNEDGKLEIDHIDKDRTNNRVTNLRWVTRKENIEYQTTVDPLPMRKRSDGIFEPIYSTKQIKKVCKLLEEGVYTYNEIEFFTGVGYWALVDIVNNRKRIKIASKYDIQHPVKRTTRWCIIHRNLINFIMVGYLDSEILASCNIPNGLTKKEFYELIRRIRKKYNLCVTKFHMTNKDVIDFFKDMLPVPIDDALTLSINKY